MFLLLLPIICSLYIFITSKKNNYYLIITGAQCARKLFDYNNLYSVDINIDNTNKYDIINDTLYLTNEEYNGKTLFAACISLYTCYKYSNSKNKKLLLIDDIIKILSTIFYWLIIVAYFLNIELLLFISVYIIVMCVLFRIIRYPYEFKNYKKTCKCVYKYQILNNKYINNYKKLLFSISFLDISKLVMNPIIILNYFKFRINI